MVNAIPARNITPPNPNIGIPLLLGSLQFIKKTLKFLFNGTDCIATIHEQPFSIYILFIYKQIFT